jgi:hypothetical protein
MTPDQEKLVLEILCGLDARSSYLNSLDQLACRFCLGREQGYYDSREFVHHEHCIVPKIEKLRETIK